MIIFFAISGVLMLYALRDYNKAFCILLCWRLFLNVNIGLKLPSLPLLAMDFVLVVYFLILYKYRIKRIDDNSLPYPLWKVTKLFVFTDLACAVFALGGPILSLPPAMTHIADLLFLCLLWKMITPCNINYIFRGLLITIIIAGAYCVFENYIEFNPLIQWEVINSQNQSTEDWLKLYDNDTRGYRAMSIFSHPIGAGANFAFLSVLMIYYWWLSRTKDFYIKIVPLVFLLAVVSSVMANSRSCLVYMGVAFLPLLRAKSSKIVLLITFFIALIYLTGLSDFFANYTDLVTSIFDIDNKNGYVGSDKDMRLSQYSAGLKIFSEYPLFGVGDRGLQFYNDKATVTALNGLESIWLQLIVCKGVLGLFTYIAFILSIIRIKISKQYKRIVVILTLAYVALCSVTSLPGGFVYLHYLTIFYVVKQYYWKSNKQIQL